MARSTPLCAAIAFLLILLTGDAWSQQASFDRTQLEELLASKKIRELRIVARVIERFPKQSLELITVVSRRANHPEITKSFETLLSHAEESQLQRLLGEETTQQKSLVEDELNKRRGGHAPGTSPMPIGNSPPPVTSRPGTGANPSGIATDLDERSLVRLESLSTLSEQDWALLFKVLDNEKDSNGSQPSRLTRMTRVLNRHVSRRSAFERVYQRFLDRSLQHPERLVATIRRYSPTPPEVVERMCEVWKSPDRQVRETVFASFPYIRERNEEIVEDMLSWAEQDSSRQYEIPGALSRCAARANVETQERIMTWLIDRVELDSARTGLRSDDYTQKSAFVTACETAVRKVPLQTQAKMAADLGTRLSRSKYPFQFVHILRAMNGDLSSSEEALRKILRSCSSVPQRLFVAKALYRASKKPREVIPLFISALESGGTNMQSALDGITIMGPDAAPIVGQLVEILKAADMQTSTHSSVIRALAAVGPDAAPALPILLNQFHTTSENVHLGRISTAIGGIGPKAEAAIEPLAKRVKSAMALNPSEWVYFCQEAFKALVAIDPNHKLVRETIQIGAQCNHRSISSMARVHAAAHQIPVTN